MKATTIYSMNEEIFPHEYLWRSSTAITKRLSGIEEDVHHLHVPALLLTLLAYEGFLNFCGRIVRPDLWSNEKATFRGKGLEAKVEAIVEHVPAFVWRKDAGCYQRIKRLEKFREVATHAKVQVNEYEATERSDGSHVTFKQEWDAFIQPGRVEQARADVQEFCESILASLRQVSEAPGLIAPAFKGSLGRAYGMGK